VASVAQSSCGLAPGGRRRDRWEEIDDRCPDATETLRGTVDRFRPDVVLVVDSMWEITDRQLPGETTWRSIGDPVYDDFLRRELGRSFDALASQGARIAVVLYPPIQLGRNDVTRPESPYPVNDPVRMERYNALLREIAASRSDTTVVDLAGWAASRPETVTDASARPDGVHLTPEAARQVADEWLAAQVVDQFDQ